MAKTALHCGKQKRHKQKFAHQQRHTSYILCAIASTQHTQNALYLLLLLLLVDSISSHLAFQTGGSSVVDVQMNSCTFSIQIRIRVWKAQTAITNAAEQRILKLQIIPVLFIAWQNEFIMTTCLLVRCMSLVLMLLFRPAKSQRFIYSLRMHSKYT